MATELRTEAYFEALEPYAIEEIDTAVRRLIAELGCVFTPTPGELIEMIHADRRAKRDQAAMRTLPAAPPSEEDRKAVRHMLDGLFQRMHSR
jgi:hypothetical protein